MESPRIKTTQKGIEMRASIKENMKPLDFKLQTITKENTKYSMEVKLQTKERAVKRAFFNYSVATKIYLMEQQKRHIDRIQQIIEEEEVKMLRKEIQLMPLFDRPFVPRRSKTPTKVAKKPSSQEIHRNGISCTYEY